MLLKEDCFLMMKVELMDCIIGLFGGCVVEEVIFGEVIIGVSNDFECVIEFVCCMVIEWGMSDKIGLF